jgi:translation initiation factor 2B subunit (eIF-2B alpha/beta/delta family)
LGAQNLHLCATRARNECRKVEGSLDTAKRTALLLRHVIADARTPNPTDLLAAVRAAGVRLTEACHTGARRRKTVPMC